MGHRRRLFVLFVSLFYYISSDTSAVTRINLIVSRSMFVFAGYVVLQPRVLQMWYSLKVYCRSVIPLAAYRVTKTFFHLLFPTSFFFLPWRDWLIESFNSPCFYVYIIKIKYTVYICIIYIHMCFVDVTRMPK